MITDKLSGRGVPFRLNAAQRRVARIMEGQRRAGKPVRIIMLKARQWGGSTLVQAYMAWHQLVRAKGRNALICAHVKDAAAPSNNKNSHLVWWLLVVSVVAFAAKRLIARYRKR